MASCDVGDERTAATKIVNGKFDVAILDHELWCRAGKTGAALQQAVSQTAGTGVVVLGGECSDERCQPSSPGDLVVVVRTEEVFAEAVEMAVDGARRRRRRETMLRWLEREATTDPVTGLHKRDVFDRELRAECDRGSRPAGLILIRVVGTGTVSHNYGREAADRMMRQAASGVIRTVRAADFAARVGPDTFGVILRDSKFEDCCRVARRVSQELERANAVEWQDETPVSVVLGVAGGTDCTARELYDRARAQIGEQRQPIPVFAFARRSTDDGPSVA